MLNRMSEKRANRNYARRKAVKAGLARRGDGKDVHHVGGNAMNRNGRTCYFCFSQSFLRQTKMQGKETQGHSMVAKLSTYGESHRKKMGFSDGRARKVVTKCR